MSKKYDIICVNNLGKDFIMRKVILGLALILGASNANAAGLYVSAGYGRSNPDLKSSAITEFGSADKCIDANGEEVFCYEDALDLPGFPNGNVLANYNGSVGYQAADWRAGALEGYDYETKSGNTMALAIGWDISQNPFRLEFEYQKTKFKSPGYVWTVYGNEEVNGYLAGQYGDKPTWSGEGDTPWVKTGTNATLGDVWVNTNIEDGGIESNSYVFDVSFYDDMSATVDSYMLNAYFEIPGFGAVDPYIGFGYGKAKVNYDFANEDGSVASGGSDGYVNAQQLIAGVEYRFNESPIIAGVEYRQFKVDFDERDDKVPYELEHKYVMFKLRYDFISEDY